MLRIGLLTSEFPPDHGGVEAYAWHLARTLGRRADLQVTVYAPRRSAAVAPPPGVSIRPVLTSCRGSDWKVLRREPVDVWHALSAAHAWIALEGRPVVVSVHGNDFLAPYPLTMRPALAYPGLRRLQTFAWSRLRPLWRLHTRGMLARALPRAARLLANSRYTASVLMSRYPGVGEKLDVTWVGVDPAFFEIKRAPKADVPQLLTVSRLSEPRKNIEQVLRALANLKDRFEFCYTVAGEGRLRPALEHLAGELGLKNHVRFTGRVSDETLRDLYANADLFVLAASIAPESHEGFGIVYLEAAASGVPSLAARLAGAAEAVAEGKSGFFVDTPDGASLTQALERFFGGDIRFDPDGCREFARQFDWDRIADVCESAYRGALVQEFGS